MTTPVDTAAKLAFADAVLKSEDETTILTILGKTVVELSEKYRRGGFASIEQPTTPTGPRLTAYVDGGARMDRKVAGCGAVIRNHTQELVYSGSFFLGETTSNRAEYYGLIRAAEAALTGNASQFSVRTDSMLLAMQVSGKWKTKHPEIKPLRDKALALLNRIPRWDISHIPRSQNDEADALATRAMDERRDEVTVDRLLPRTGDDTAAA
ncbi:MAG TPA: ribonuclease HI family protein [Phycisphaerae bacterium]|nr:ribonuclease HI family protein [Phycisphaerae bacterium]